VVLVLIGIAAAFRRGHFHWLQSILLMIGVILAHVSVNLFNELSDFLTGIDSHTVRTPFSGGSGSLQSGNTSYKGVSVTAGVSLLVAAGIGVYFCFASGWLILVFMIPGGVAILFYTSFFAKWLFGEFISGLTLGSFVVMGTFYALTGTLGKEVILLSIPPGILTALLLFLNEFPDQHADRLGGRRHLVIYFGSQRASVIYIVALAAVYVIIIGLAVLGNSPLTILISLITLPLAFKSARTVKEHHDDPKKMIPALAANVGVVILTDLLLAVGYLI
jgi:1,4-dihydroxy-2-naphthoate octaprenyltransferase